MGNVGRLCGEQSGNSCVKIQEMRIFFFIGLLALSFVNVTAQSAAQKIYETERAFEKMAAEKGINAAFIEFLTPDSVGFFPDLQNAPARWKSRPPSTAFLTWNPILIDVASNGVLAYSIGNSIFRPKGKDDPTQFAGHYISIWVRQPDGSYRAALDTGINHEKPATVPTDWKSPAGSGSETNPKRISAADSSTGFYQMAAEDSKKAYKNYLADDAVLLRDEKQPFFGKSAAMKYLGEQKGTFSFGKRKSFVEAPDLAYVHSSYSIVDKDKKEIEHGNFVQVWKLRKDRWQIVADILLPIPAK